MLCIYIFPILLSQAVLSRLENSNAPGKWQAIGQAPDEPSSFSMGSINFDNINFPFSKEILESKQRCINSTEQYLLMNVSSSTHQKMNANIPKSEKILNTDRKSKENVDKNSIRLTNKYPEDISKCHKFMDVILSKYCTLSKKDIDYQNALIAKRNNIFLKWPKSYLSEYMSPVFQNNNIKFSKMPNYKVYQDSEVLFPLVNHKRCINFRKGILLQDESREKISEELEKKIEGMHFLMPVSTILENSSFSDNANYQDNKFGNKLFNVIKLQEKARCSNGKRLKCFSNKLAIGHSDPNNLNYYTNRAMLCKRNAKSDFEHLNLISDDYVEPIIITIQPGLIHIPKRGKEDVATTTLKTSHMKISIGENGVPYVVGNPAGPKNSPKKQPCKGNSTTTATGRTSTSSDNKHWDFTTIMDFTIDRSKWNK